MSPKVLHAPLNWQRFVLSMHTNPYTSLRRSACGGAPVGRYSTTLNAYCTE